MKKIAITLTGSLVVAGIVLSSCNSPKQKVESAENNVVQANEDLDKANREYAEEVENYRRETAERIAANDKSAEEFRKRIELDKKEVRADYNRKIAELEQKNSDLKKKMDAYKADTKDNWKKFKVEFNRDMDELGKAFKDLTVKNVK